MRKSVITVDKMSEKISAVLPEGYVKGAENRQWRKVIGKVRGRGAYVDSILWVTNESFERRIIMRVNNFHGLRATWVRYDAYGNFSEAVLLHRLKRLEKQARAKCQESRF